MNVPSSPDGQLLNNLVMYNMKSLMPKIEIKTFSGDFTEYSTFIKSFDNLIGSRLTENDERLFYLSQNTKGKPQEIVKAI